MTVNSSWEGDCSIWFHLLPVPTGRKRRHKLPFILSPKWEVPFWRVFPKIFKKIFRYIKNARTDIAPLDVSWHGNILINYENTLWYTTFKCVFGNRIYRDFLTDLPAFRSYPPLKDICYLYSGRHGSGFPKYALLCALPLPHSQKGIRKTLK